MKLYNPSNLPLALGAFTVIGLGGYAGNNAPSGATNGVVSTAPTAVATLAPVKNVSDTEFARRNFAALSAGKSTAEAAIDWQNFHSMGMRVGETYAQMPDENKKDAFRKSFIEKFAQSFKSKVANPSDLSNWRVEKATPAQTIVLATAPSGKIIALTVNKTSGAQKLTALEIR